MYPEFPFSSSAGDYSTNQSNNYLLIRLCHLAHWEVNCHPEMRGDMLLWSEITVPLVTCHLPHAICLKLPPISGAGNSIYSGTNIRAQAYLWCNHLDPGYHGDM
ncbi:hypothetical protein E2C01_034550 [Portunus trituberculatus]|uniref:Uncharacterized protein n=1 Tax=Portunus trituberculatus TaxID=210409 RepID=A0A5B7F7C1_PORTR|nr:hypothetical protein [Portunus trituberculatus]